MQYRQNSVRPKVFWEAKQAGKEGRSRGSDIVL